VLTSRIQSDLTYPSSYRDQQDAQEFYSGCIDAVSTDINRAIKLLSANGASAKACPLVTSKALESPVEILDDTGGKDALEKVAMPHKRTVLPPAVEDLKQSNVCNLNMNLQVTQPSRALPRSFSLCTFPWADVYHVVH
jgi:hypothetical protein